MFTFFGVVFDASLCKHGEIQVCLPFLCLHFSGLFSMLHLVNMVKYLKLGKMVKSVLFFFSFISSIDGLFSDAWPDVSVRKIAGESKDKCGEKTAF